MKIKKYIQFITNARSQKGENLALVPLFFKLSIWILRNRGGLIMFFLLGLHKKGKKFKEYMTQLEYWKIYKKLYPPYYSILLEDKFVFDRFIKSYDFPIAELLALIQYGKIRWIKNGITEPLDNIKNYNLHCFCKMHLKWGGKQVYKLDVVNGSISIDNKESDLENLKKIIGNEIFILQKTIIQHSELNRLNNSCINSLRIVTLQEDEKIKIYLKSMRIGIRGSIVDNASQGNLIIGINDDGTLKENATTFGIDLNWLTHHPTTHVEFKGFKIPFFQETLDLTKRLHNGFHCFLLIAWDIAITENGPVIIEGNPLGDIFWPQIINNFGDKKELLKTVNKYLESDLIKY